MGLLDKLFGGTKLRPILAAHPEVGPVLEALTARMDVAPARAAFTAPRGRRRRGRRRAGRRPRAGRQGAQTVAHAVTGSKLTWHATSRRG
jgi:hypothetical protein